MLGKPEQIKQNVLGLFPWEPASGRCLESMNYVVKTYFYWFTLKLFLWYFMYNVYFVYLEGMGG
jgi:hypothetical protein